MLSAGAGAALGPLAPRLAAQSPPLKRLGFLTLAPSAWFRAHRIYGAMIVPGLKKLGWEDGRNLAFVFPPDAVHAKGMDAAAQWLVGEKVDVIYSAHEFAAEALLRATRTTPIVTFTSAAVELGFAKSLARPGGNITGVMTQSYEEHGKVLSLLREMRPGLSRIGFSVGREINVWNTWFESFVAAARPTGVQVIALPPHHSPAHIQPMLDAGTRDRVQVLITGPAWWLNENKAVWDQIHTWAAEQKVITKGSIVQRGHVVLAFGVGEEVVQMIVEQIARVLRGANPAELPFMQSTRFDCVVNQRLARAVGWPAPPVVLLQATEVIE